ncbi:MAG: hypothetical protein D6696_04385, partial [Acidobacteria bacterium]
MVSFGSFAEFTERMAGKLAKSWLFVETAERLPAGTPVRLELKLEQGSVLVRALGAVEEVHEPNGPQRPAGLRVALTYLDPASAGLIDSVYRYAKDWPQEADFGPPEAAEAPAGTSAGKTATPTKPPAPAAATRAETPAATVGEQTAVEGPLGRGTKRRPAAASTEPTADRRRDVAPSPPPATAGTQPRPGREPAAAGGRTAAARAEEEKPVERAAPQARDGAANEETAVERPAATGASAKEEMAVEGPAAGAPADGGLSADGEPSAEWLEVPLITEDELADWPAVPLLAESEVEAPAAPAATSPAPADPRPAAPAPPPASPAP